jgi:NAD(P)-dependent dehydrogenase (short-subunit alcohol dehydrogenase family)
MRDGGSIILVGSGAGHKGVPGYTTCSATKAALRSFARTWTAEFKNRGIRVNNLSVGPIETPMIDSQVDTKGALMPSGPSSSPIWLKMPNAPKR